MPISALKIEEAMAAHGIEPQKPIDIQADGKVVRFRIAGDKPGSNNGWLVLNGDSANGYYGAFGSWKSGETHTWRSTQTESKSFADRLESRKRAQALRATYLAERVEVQAQAQAKAKRLWERARPATNSHPYLMRKGVNSYGLRQLRDMLLVPARDIEGNLHTLQFIGADGSKRFLTGGRIAGCYFAIGKPIDSLLVAEGMATASTLYQATGRAVAACFSCGNMEAVARALRLKFPDMRLVICADNDVNTKGNPGITKALEAAKAVGGLIAIPKFSEVVTCKQ